jgi:histidyl-tRNA synthetase
MAASLWRELGLTDVQLELNSLGQPHERAVHRAALITYLEGHQDQLDEDAKRRLYSNPLRILDTKNPALQAIVAQAPRLLDYLGDESKAHFQQLQSILQANGQAYAVNPRLVRGMDYYNLTVFEFTTQRLGAQGTICAGGRYDYLFEQLGGKSSPAVGWALGVDRVLELAQAEGNWKPSLSLDAYVVLTDAEALGRVMVVVESLRRRGVRVQMHPSSTDGMGSMKSQFKKADASGANFALIFGADELAQSTVTVKPLRDATLQQTTLAIADLDQWVARLQLL